MLPFPTILSVIIDGTTETVHILFRILCQLTPLPSSTVQHSQHDQKYYTPALGESALCRKFVNGEITYVTTEMEKLYRDCF